MTFQGHVKNGVIVLDPPAQLPEGAAVTVQVNEPQTIRPARPLMKYAGQAADLSEDASQTIDRVLYGERSS